MNDMGFNNNFLTSSMPHRDVLSVFKEHPEKSLTVQQGMSAKEISDIVSEKVIEVVKEQFRITKERFQGKEDGGKEGGK